MALTGGCRCGAVRYAAEGMPAHSALCHCRDCQRSAGAPVVGWALFAREQVTVEGSPTMYRSSPDAVRAFCATCGTGLLYTNEAIFPGQVDIQTATLDDPDQLPPQIRIQVAEAPGWFDSVPALPGFARYPQ